MKKMIILSVMLGLASGAHAMDQDEKNWNATLKESIAQVTHEGQLGPDDIIGVVQPLKQLQDAQVVCQIGIPNGKFRFLELKDKQQKHEHTVAAQPWIFERCEFISKPRPAIIPEIITIYKCVGTPLDNEALELLNHRINVFRKVFRDVEVIRDNKGTTSMSDGADSCQKSAVVLSYTDNRDDISKVTSITCYAGSSKGVIVEHTMPLEYPEEDVSFLISTDTVLKKMDEFESQYINLKTIPNVSIPEVSQEEAALEEKLNDLIINGTRLVDEEQYSLAYENYYTQAIEAAEQYLKTNDAPEIKQALIEAEYGAALCLCRLKKHQEGDALYAKLSKQDHDLIIKARSLFNMGHFRYMGVLATSQNGAHKHRQEALKIFQDLENNKWFGHEDEDDAAWCRYWLAEHCRTQAEIKVGKEATKLLREAFARYEKVSKQNVNAMVKASAEYRIAELYYGEFIFNDKKKARRMYEQLENNSDLEPIFKAWALYGLAEMNRLGEGGPQNIEKARSLYRQIIATPEYNITSREGASVLMCAITELRKMDQAASSSSSASKSKKK
jgi:tetratricopeptide (TPR) repeat protein